MLHESWLITKVKNNKENAGNSEDDLINEVLELLRKRTA